MTPQSVNSQVGLPLVLPVAAVAFDMKLETCTQGSWGGTESKRSSPRSGLWSLKNRWVEAALCAGQCTLSQLILPPTVSVDYAQGRGKGGRGDLPNLTGQCVAGTGTWLCLLFHAHQEVADSITAPQPVLTGAPSLPRLLGSMGLLGLPQACLRTAAGP